MKHLLIAILVGSFAFASRQLQVPIELAIFGAAVIIISLYALTHKPRNNWRIKNRYSVKM